MIRTLMNTANTAVMPSWNRADGHWLSDASFPPSHPETNNGGRWISAKNGATMMLASRGPCRSWRVCCMNPVQPVSSQRLTSTTGTNTPHSPPHKYKVKSNSHFCASSSIGANPKNGMAPNTVARSSPKSARRYQCTLTRHLKIRPSSSRTPSWPSVAAVTKKAGSARPKIERMAANGIHGSSIGITVTGPFSESSRGSMPPHPNAKAMIRKEVTGWRATTPLIEEEELAGCLSSVVVDINRSPFSIGSPGSPCLNTSPRRSGEVRLLHPRLGPYSHRLSGRSAQDAPSYPRPAYHQHHSPQWHRKRGARGADRRPVHETQVHQHVRPSPQRSRPPRQRPGAPDSYPQEDVAHEPEQDHYQTS